jgi:hypothetical protein
LAVIAFKRELTMIDYAKYFKELCDLLDRTEAVIRLKNLAYAENDRLAKDRDLWKTKAEKISAELERTIKLQHKTGYCQCHEALDKRKSRAEAGK